MPKSNSPFPDDFIFVEPYGNTDVGDNPGDNEPISSFEQQFGGVADINKRPGAPPESRQRSGNNDGRGGNNKKQKRILILVLTAIALLVVVAAIALILGNSSQSIKPVMTNPTKDIALITGIGGLEDPVSASLWEGIEEAGRQKGLTVTYIVPKVDTEKEFNSILDEACKEYQTVVCYGQHLADNLLIKAQTYTQTRFIYFDGSVFTGEGDTATLANVLEVGFRVEEASYLAGYMSVKISSKTCLGFIGGRDEPAMRSYYGYYAGAMYANQVTEIRSGLPGSSSDGNKRMKSLASDLYKDGVQIIFYSVDNAYGQAIKEIAQQEKKKVITSGGVPKNAGSEVLTTVVKKYDIVVKDILEKSAKNTLTYGERVYYGYTENALELMKPATSDVSDSLWKQVEDLRGRVANGQIKVPGTKEEFESKK
ncbi:MAG: BMP family ABC transporter substrate-binding protein [Peptococcaceae bacterium]|nr:BMP family ABC transporter substrate-binding protein [Peptococcaceae bacterium]